MSIRHAEKERKSSCRFADDIAFLVIEKFKYLKEIHCLDLKQTVVSAFLLHDGENLELVSIAYGTTFYEKTESGLHDCHAEILARRGFLVQLVKKSEIYFDSQPDGFRLKPKYTVHLYTSSAPCGNSCLARYCKGKKDDFQDLDLWPVEEHEKIYFTQVDEIEIERKGETLNWSCSDKILKWNAVGVQGSILSIKLEPIFLTSIVCGRKYSKKRLRRGVCCRLFDFTVNHPSLMTSRLKLDESVYEEAAEFSRDYGCFVEDKKLNDEEMSRQSLYNSFSKLCELPEFETAKVGSKNYEEKLRFLFRNFDTRKLKKKFDFFINNKFEKTES